jgi:pyridoxine 5-phosphate synthase
MEMASTDEMIGIAISLKPLKCTLVPEKREELTTEGGLDVLANFEHLKETVKELQTNGIIVSLFVDPVVEQIDACAELGVEEVELHTGEYANARTADEQEYELSRLIEASRQGAEKDLVIAAGHGLTYQNVRSVAEIPEVVELNIGHSIVSRSVFTGIQRAVREMIEIIRGCM